MNVETPRPMTGHFSTLTQDQQKAALAYRGDEHIGDPSYPKEPRRKFVIVPETLTTVMIEANNKALHEGVKALGWSRKARSERLNHNTKVVLRWSAMLAAAPDSQMVAVPRDTLARLLNVFGDTADDGINELRAILNHPTDKDRGR